MRRPKILLLLLTLSLGAAVALTPRTARAEQKGAWYWEDYNGNCPASCDVGKYNCPCWKAF